ncbi:MAG: SLC13 family permease [Desulfobacterales bacterium]|jgi:di/tricarboxylate transporter
MEATAVTTEMMMVMAMIGIAIFLFIAEWIRVDMVAILMTVSLPLLHLVTPKEAFSGFSSNAVISIIAVIIIGAGLDKTAVINRMVRPVVRIAGNSSSRVVIAMGVTVALISSFMQNIGAAALFLPAIKRVSKSMNISLSRMLMPIGFCAILGGTITLVGCSPLILLNDLIAPFKLKPFNLFDVTPIGLALVGSGIVFFIFFGRFVLPGGDGAKKSGEAPLSDLSAVLGDLFELKTPPEFTDFRDPITVKDIRDRYLVNVVALAGRDGIKQLSLVPDTQIRSGNDLVAYGTAENVRKMAQEQGIQIKDQVEIFKNEMSASTTGTIEAVVAPRSSLIGKTLRQAHFWEQFQVNPLAIYRSDKVFHIGLSDMELRSGDSILLHGTWERFNILQERHNFIFTTPVSEALKPEKGLIAGFWLAVSLTMIIFFKIQLSVSLLSGAFGMIVCRVLTIDEAYQAVDWRTVFLLAGLIPLGIATENTGTAAWIAREILNLIGNVSPVVLLTVIAMLATGFTLVISNVGATVLLVPLVVNMAITSGTDPRMAALVVGIATSNSFMLPTHQVNALYMGPGRYRSVDFMKAGGMMSILFIVVLVAMLYLFYGI